MIRIFWVAFVATILLAGTVYAQSSQATSKDYGQMGMMANCQKMIAGTKAGQERLDELIAKMNAATGELKVDQIAAVLTELVAQQKAMHARMTCMGREPASPASAPKEPSQSGHEQHH
jgi:ABC-type glycerol-3-phosphate transport system substrate-binding protein